MSRPTDWIEIVSQANWPAMRVRNIVKEFEKQRARQFMPLSNPPPKRMPREKGVEWLAKTAGIPLNDFKLMRPVQFVQQYVLGSCEQHARVLAVRIVHGITTSAMYGHHESKDCADDLAIQHAREQLLTQSAVEEVVAAPPAQEEVVEVVVAAAPAAAAEDHHMFEPPPVSLVEVAARLASLRESVDVHIAEREEAELAEQREQDREALNHLSDRLVSSELRLGLIDDALDHMYAGQQSPANVVGRLAAIIARITAMDI